MTWQWRRINTMVSQITDDSTVCSTVATQKFIKEDIKAPSFWPFVRGIPCGRSSRASESIVYVPGDLVNNKDYVACPDQGTLEWYSPFQSIEFWQKIHTSDASNMIKST